MAKPARKTVEVGKVLRMVNSFLAAKNTTDDEREGVAALMEAILFETGNYMGFRYLESSDYPEEVQSGSRRYYYPSNAVRDEFEAELRNVNRIRV
jgi:hypothetical protein